MTSDHPRAGQTDSHHEARSSVRGAVAYIGELHGSIVRPVALLVALGTLAGLAEAAALLAFVRAAVVITTDTVDPIEVPGLGGELSPGSLLLFAFALTCVVAGLHLLVARRSTALSLDVANSTRRRLISGFLNAEWSFVASHREGQLQEAVLRLTESTTRATAHLALGLSSLVIVAVLGLAALVVDPMATVTLMAVPIVIALCVRPLLHTLQRRADVDVQGSLGLAQEATVTVNFAKEYRTFGVQQARADQLIGIAEQHGRRVARTRIAGFTMSFAFKDIALIALIGVVGLLYVVSDLSDGAVIAVVLLMIRLLGYLQQSVRLLQEGAEDGAAIGVLRGVMDDVEAHVEVDGSIAIDSIGNVMFHDVHYSYVSDRQALNGVDLVIEPRTTVGLIGPSGAGKSTIAELLLGLRRPDAGTVTVDDVDLADVQRASWTHLTAMVPQDQHLAALSIADNIAFLRPIDRDEIIHAAQLAHVHDEITALPGGYDHVVGPRSQGLSGGQRQRIAIARALAGHPDLLVLDEPTSALDAETEQRFRQTLDELHGKVTIVIIAHRPATLEACDTVVHVFGGKVTKVEPGPRRIASEASVTP